MPLRYACSGKALVFSEAIARGIIRTTATISRSFGANIAEEERDGIHRRSNRRFAVSFGAFLVRQEKHTVPPRGKFVFSKNNKAKRKNYTLYTKFIKTKNKS